MKDISYWLRWLKRQKLNFKKSTLTEKGFNLVNAYIKYMNTNEIKTNEIRNLRFLCNKSTMKKNYDVTHTNVYITITGFKFKASIDNSLEDNIYKLYLNDKLILNNKLK